MKRFLRTLLYLFLTLLGLAIALDAIFTYTYKHAISRNKFQEIIVSEPKEWDYVFLGSSRTANHIDAEWISKTTQKSAFNYGIEGALLNDNLLQLRLMLAKKTKIKKLFLQVDYAYEVELPSQLAISKVLPFIHNDVVSAHLRDDVPNFNALYFIPFYRYTTAEHSIGFREVLLSWSGKASKSLEDQGLIPMEGHSELKAFELPKTIAKQNRALEEIIALCKQNQIELVLFCAPICSKVPDLTYIKNLKKRYPELLDFSDSMEDRYFYNCEHLNHEGATIFTKQLMEVSENIKSQQ